MCEFNDETLDNDFLYQVCTCGKHIWSKNAQRIMGHRNGVMKITNAKKERVTVSMKPVGKSTKKNNVEGSRDTIMLLIFMLIVCMFVMTFATFDFKQAIVAVYNMAAKIR